MLCGDTFCCVAELAFDSTFLVGSFCASYSCGFIDIVVLRGDSNDKLALDVCGALALKVDEACEFTFCEACDACDEVFCGAGKFTYGSVF